jgi:vacuolar-type H+-ATPase subunit I/STV1
MHRTVSQKIEDIDCIAAVMEMVKEKSYNKDEAKLHASQHSIIGLSNFEEVLKRAKKLREKLKSIEWLDSSDRRVNEVSRLLFDGRGGSTGSEKKVRIKRAFPGLAWSSDIRDDSCYFQLYRQINSEEHNVESAIANLARLYSREYERKTFLRSVTLLLDEYFDRFAANNAIRLIFNNICPFIFTEAEEVQFAEALFKFKKSPEYSYSLLKDDLHCIFQKDLTKEQEMEQS